MRTKLLLLGMLVLLPRLGAGQSLSPDDKKLLEAARSRYYNLTARGLVSFQCNVKFDIATVPWQLLPETAVADRKLLGDTQFVLKMQRSGTVVTPLFPVGTNAVAQSTVAPQVNWMRSIVGGFFQTWPTIGLQGPLPPFDSQIGMVTPTQTGYAITLIVPGGPVTLVTDKTYLVTRVTSLGGRVDEQPRFTGTAEGLVYSGNHAISDDAQGNKSDIRFDFDSSIVDEFRLPNKVHVQVNDNVDVQFWLSQCSVVRATVIKLNP